MAMLSRVLASLATSASSATSSSAVSISNQVVSQTSRKLLSSPNDFLYLAEEYALQSVVFLAIFIIIFSISLAFLLSHPRPIKPLQLSFHLACCCVSFIEICSNFVILVNGMTPNSRQAFDCFEDISTCIGYTCMHFLCSLTMRNANLAVHGKAAQHFIAPTLIMWIPTVYIFLGFLVAHIGLGVDNTNTWPGIFLFFCSSDASVVIAIISFYYYQLHNASVQVAPVVRNKSYQSSASTSRQPSSLARANESANRATSPVTPADPTAASSATTSDKDVAITIPSTPTDTNDKGNTGKKPLLHQTSGSSTDIPATSPRDHQPSNSGTNPHKDSNPKSNPNTPRQHGQTTSATTPSLARSQSKAALHSQNSTTSAANVSIADKLKPLRDFITRLGFCFIFIIAYQVYAMIDQWSDASAPYLQYSQGEPLYFQLFIIIIEVLALWSFRIPVDCARLHRRS